MTEFLRAELQAITWDTNQKVRDLPKKIHVQLNPETLKVNFANQNSGGDQRGGGPTQYVARGTTKLTFDLWYDVSLPQPDGQRVKDVRKLTEQLVYFLQPQKELDGAPPGVRFLWGTFLFEGRMDSLNETLDLFSEDGKPLRASVSVSLSQQEIQFKFGKQQPPGQTAGSGAAGPGTTPQQEARQGDSVQSMAARGGEPENWQGMAAANGIENPRRLAAGVALDLRASVSAGAQVTTGLSVSLPRPAVSAGVSVSAQASVTPSRIR